MRTLTNLYQTSLNLLSRWTFALVVVLLLTQDIHKPLDTSAQVRSHVRDIEFDFVDWTVQAVLAKLGQASVGEQAYVTEAARAQLVRDYMALRRQADEVERAIAARYGDPAVADPEAATASLRDEQAVLRAQLGELQPVVEAIVQEQISMLLAEEGLAIGGQPLPPVSFRFTPLPLALVISPRDTIRQVVNMDVSGDLTVEAQVELEDRVASALDVSTLLAPLGGIGTYPTMVAQSSDLNWLMSVVAHEWAHNYLTLRPLGVNYMTSAALRTMNETTAEIVGNEIGARVIARYYADLAPPEPPFLNILRRDLPPEADQQAPAFDFRAEMHSTRVRVDALLAEGKIEDAEAYMEMRRRFLWDHGYQLRKLNQAYFAFYGAYAAGGAGASGVDPVGPAVELLRRRSPSLQGFLDAMAGFSSFEQLQQYLANQ